MVSNALLDPRRINAELFTFVSLKLVILIIESKAILLNSDSLIPSISYTNIAQTKNTWSLQIFISSTFCAKIKFIATPQTKTFSAIPHGTDPRIIDLEKKKKHQMSLNHWGTAASTCSSRKLFYFYCSFHATWRHTWHEYIFQRGTEIACKYVSTTC